MSNPASRELATAWRKSSTIPEISSSINALGVEVSTRIAWPFSSRNEVRVPEFWADGATGAKPSGCKLLCEIRPVCQSCTAMRPFFA